MSNIISILAFIGLLTLISLTIKLLNLLHFITHKSTLGCYTHGPSPTLNLANPSPKPWVLITGASDGIGLGLARHLCAHNFNAVLHGRPSPKLTAAKLALETDFNTEIRLLPIDASLPWTDQTTAQVLSTISDVNLTLLINNVGGPGNLPIFAPITSRTLSDDAAILNINISFMAHLTHTCLPFLMTNTPACILNISSAVESLPAPWSTLYSGSKAFVKQYTHSLRLEMIAENKDVEVLSITVGKVVTKGAGRTERDRKWDTPLSERFAKSVLGTVGWKRAATEAYWGHKLSLGLLRWLPGRVVDGMVMGMMREEMEVERERRGKEKDKGI